MMKHLALHVLTLTLLALTFDLGWGQELDPLPQSWLPDKFPNPQTQPQKCGLSKPGYVCDPNSILTRQQLKTLNWFLQGIAETINLRECPCSRYFCEKHDGQRFYKVAVALVPSLAIPRSSDGRSQSVLNQANTFAYRLESHLWNMGSCEEDIVILYSRDDRALVTMTGRTAGRKLTAQARNVIHAMVGQTLADGHINQGLERMVYEIELVLSGKRQYIGNMAGQSGGAERLLSSGSWFLLPLTALLSAWTVRSITTTASL